MVEVNMILVLIGVGNFVFNFQKWTACKKRIGIIKYKWSTRLDPRIPRNRRYLFILIIYIVVSFYFLLSPPKMISNYTMLVFLLLVMSFAPKWNAAVGPSAIILGTEIISREEILDRRLVTKGKSKFIELKWSSGEGGSVVKEKTVAFPFQRLEY